MPEHYSPEDVAHFLAGRLSRRRSQEFVRHLLHGCGTCSSLLATHGGWAPAEMPLASYDAVISRAKANATPAVATPQNATPAVATPQDAVVILTSLLLGERSWEALSASDIATLRGLPQVRALIEAGRSLRSHDVHATLRFARLARFAADRLDPKELGAKPVADLRGLAWAELANAHRICDDLPRASQAMNRAVYWSNRGSRSSLLLARVADLLASLLSAQRRFDEAVALLRLVHRTHALEGRRHLAGRALISIGHFTAAGGEAGTAIMLLHDGLELLDHARDPVLVAKTLQSLIWFLVDLGRFRAARRLLWSSRIVLEENPNALDRLRVRWLEGRIYAGLCDFARAEAALLETRAGFAQREQVYPAALAGLDLATLWARQGRFEEVRLLAQEMIVTFRALRIAREAIVTLLILQRACVGDGGQLLEIIEMVVTFLNDLERQPARRKE